MTTPVEISYRDINKTEEIDSLIRDKTEKLEKICDYITSCRVAVEKPHRNIKTGNPYRVRINIHVPHSPEIVIKREPGEGEMNDTLNFVIREAFSAARKTLKELVERQRFEVKKHPEQEVTAVVEKIFPDENYGFLKTVNGREIYFHKNSILNHKDEFENIKPGTGVRFFEEMGQNGPQASSVQLLGKSR